MNAPKTVAESPSEGLGSADGRAKPILAGGAVVTREHPERGTEVVIIHRAKYDDWSLPKGKSDAGELLPVAAVREVWEETGTRIRLGTPLDSVGYSTSLGFKHVQYWVGTMLETQKRAPDHEVDVVAWVPIRVALSRLSFARDKFLLEQSQQQPATTPLVILRHAKAMDRKDWSKKDTARPLNARGRRQVKLLVPLLAAYGVVALVTSTSTRCVATLEPYAAANRLRIKKQAVLNEEEGTDNPRRVRNLVSRIRSSTAAGTPTVLCFHRPVLPTILEALDLVSTTIVTGEMVIAHLTESGDVHAIERHRPQA